MKKTISFVLLATASLTAGAQQLPNIGFDQWKATCGNTFQAATNMGGASTSPAGDKQRPGTEPEGWNGTNVKQTVFMTATNDKLVTKQTENDNVYAKLSNQYVGAFGIGATAPAYLTFGTPWSYPTAAMEKQDGGTFGGTEFAFRPDAIKGRFKRINISGKEEKAHIIVYLWKGTFKSKIGEGGNPIVEKDDVDRAVFGKSNAGDVTGDGKLIASADYEFSTTTNDDWQEIVVPINYVNNTDIPEKMNVIISSADYWTRSNIQETKDGVDGSTLNADDVQFVYYHSLTSLTYDGTKAEVAEGTTAIDLSNVEYDATKTLTFEKKGQGATIETAYDAATAVLTVTVKGNDYDADNSSQTVYKVQFKKAAAETVQEYSNNLLIYFPSSSTWIPSEGDTKIKLVSTENPESHSFLLENFSFQNLPLGDIKIENLAVAEQEDGSSVYTGSQQISLHGGNITADAKVTATVKGDDMRAVIDITNATAVGDITVYFAPKVTVSPDASIAASAATGQVNVSFARTFSKGWSTLCLPFPYAVAELGDGVKVQSFESATDNSVSFAEFTGEELAANTPYLVYFPAETSVGTTDAPKYVAATVESYEPQAVNHGAFSFTGNYEADKNMEGLYGVATVGGVQKIMRGTASATLPATAAFFTYNGAAQANAFTLNLGGTVTGIEGIEANGSADAAPVYNLQGVRVSDGSLEGLPAGVYVKGGKKIIVKK